MSDSSLPESSESERRLEEILAAFLAAEDAGQSPELESLLKQHPDLAVELRAFLGVYDRVRVLAAPLRAVASVAGGPAELADRDVVSTLPASHQPVGITTEMTDAITAIVNVEAGPTDDPDATAPVIPEAPPECDLLDAGTRVRYFGDYELLRVLGRGGMGIVYKARQLSLNRPVALKMLQAGTLASEDDLRRFQNEAEAVAMLDHPHIVPILEVGQYEEQRYFSMKLIGGPSLDRKLGAYMTDPKAAARLVRTIAEAVHHAHQRGILHRDLKPGNVLLDERGEPHVTDFGLAKRVQADSELTQSGAILGTPAYMAPEQASGQRGMVTTSTDVYGLGAILYALLTGKAPFGGDSPVETLEQVRERTPAPPSKLNPRVPRDLEIIAMKCLEKDPTRRYASAQALADDLRRYVGGESILARPVWLPIRTWMWCRRKPVLACLAAALALAMLISVFGSIGLVVIERARRREAEARMEAELNFVMAQKAVEDYLTSVSENTLLKEQDSLDSRGLRRELLENALKYYRRFVDQRSQDPLVRRELANAYFSIGKINRELGSPQEALRVWASARAIWEALVAADPHDREAAARLADCYLAIGKVQYRIADNLQGSLETLNQAQALLETLTTRHPDVPSFQVALASCNVEIGIVVTRLEAPDQGLALLAKARSIQERLIGRSPGEDGYRMGLAELLSAQGFVFSTKPDSPAALGSFQEAREICQRLLERVPAGPKPIRYLDFLALSHYNIGILLLQQGAVDQALKSYEESLQYRSTLARTHPSVPKFQENLAVIARELAHVQHLAHQDRAAADSLQRSREILEGLVRSQPDRAGYHSHLGRTWNLMGYFRNKARENAQALTAFQHAVDEQRLAVDRSEEIIEYKDELCIYLDNLGEQYLDLGRASEGLPCYEEAIGIRRKLRAIQPKNRDYALNLAKALANFGNIQRHAGDSSAAIQSFTEARSVLEAISAAAPGDAAMLGQLGAILSQEACAMADLEPPERALPLLQKAVDILSDIPSSAGDEVQQREWLSEALWELGRFLRASKKSAEADRCDERRLTLWKGRPPRELADLALKQASRAALIGYGRTSVGEAGQAGRELDLAQAVDHLRLAISQGFTDLPMLRSHPDSSLLLGRDDLKPLLMDLGFPRWPFDGSQ
jgi:serine/threonine-protein kinase